MAGNEVFTVDTWIYGILSGDATLTALLANGAQSIYRDYVREGDPFPAVVFAYGPPIRDTMGVGTARVLVRAYYEIKAIGQGTSYAGLLAIANRIDTLFHGKQNVFAGPGQALACVREHALSYPEISSGEEFRHLGGLYLIHVQPA